MKKLQFRRSLISVQSIQVKSKVSAHESISCFVFQLQNAKMYTGNTLTGVRYFTKIGTKICSEKKYDKNAIVLIWQKL